MTLAILQPMHTVRSFLLLVASRRLPLSRGPVRLPRPFLGRAGAIPGLPAPLLSAAPEAFGTGLGSRGACPRGERPMGDPVLRRRSSARDPGLPGGAGKGSDGRRGLGVPQRWPLPLNEGCVLMLQAVSDEA
ncbi:hypothetical protein Trco_007821 [Trichoderma cornu-damae]|uniref:Uncharacterized protein n=1 Tax=Trichoderma cornu-damae TaxID=654480 RepID=A0A9P8QG85_9HYPO|nr:hypothetical protein Trco_007821 [Trichoderma cornu-damae]